VTASFRDPGGRFCFIDNRAIRFVRPTYADDLRAFLSSDLGRSLVSEGALIASRELEPREVDALSYRLESDAPGWGAVVESERVPFVSYASEWAPSMLHAAAALTIDVAARLAAAGRGLKDATPGNVLFRGTSPVLVDLLSTEPRDAGDPIWRAHGQFVRAFLIPLLLYRASGLSPSRVFARGSAGIDPEEAAPMLPLSAKLVGRGRSLVTVPMLLSPAAERLGSKLYEQRRTSAEQASFTLRRLFAGLRRDVDGLAPRDSSSRWSAYMEVAHDPSYHTTKQAIVEQMLGDAKPARVLDVGANTGAYSLIAARRGASVVAIDSDVAAIDRCVCDARASRADVLPLVVDIASPTPAVGWNNREEMSFIERSEGRFDLVLALAIVHHIVISAGVPLSDALERLMSFAAAGGRLLIEFIPPGDPMVVRLARGREIDAHSLARESFEAVCARLGTIEQQAPVGETGRVLYLVRRTPHVA